MSTKSKKTKKLNLKKLKLSETVVYKKNVYSGGCGYTDFSCTNVR